MRWLISHNLMRWLICLNLMRWLICLNLMRWLICLNHMRWLICHNHMRWLICHNHLRWLICLNLMRWLICHNLMRWLICLNLMRWLICLNSNQFNYHNDHKYSGRQIWPINIDPHQTASKSLLSSSVIRDCTDCHSVCIFWMHKVKQNPRLDIFLSEDLNGNLLSILPKMQIVHRLS